jgi:uncharacterized repeat protein (TIGR01451 family)
MNKKIIILVASIIILLTIFGIWIYGQMMFSKEILRLEILGPESAKVGEEITYTIKYKDNGNIALENPKLTFVMPENSLTEDGKTLITQNLEDIYPGQEKSVQIKTRLLGKEGDLKTAKASLSYTPKNLTARYESDTTFTTKIDIVPIALDFDLPTKAEKGKDLQYSINYFSNIDYPMENLSVKLDPVTGFDFKSATPSSLDYSEWKLATLNKAQGGRIIIKGAISADTNQNLNFVASLGMRQNGNFIVIKQTSVTVQIIQPLLFISQQVNGSDNYIASPGETLRYQIFFKNIGSSSFENLFVIVRLNGDALDMSTIQPEDGRVQQNDNMIVWDSSQSSQLRRLDVQGQGEINFSVKVKSNWNTSGVDSNNIVITDEVNISQITQKFTVKVNSGLVISQQGFFKDSDIQNIGSIPPKVGKATTYTINWQIKNYFSDAKNVKIKATLPKNISLTGRILPLDAISNFSFDSVSRQIVWSVGDVLAGTGVTGDPISLSFQVSLTPTSDQRGSVAQLIGNSSVSGENQFTNTTISAFDSGIDTSLPDDFSNSGGGIVQ